jgi:cytochrome c553
MIKRTLLITLLGLAASLSLGTAQAETQAENQSKAEAKALIDGDAAAGAKLSPTCAACHGADGNSQNPVWPKLAGQSAPFIFHQLQLFKSGERQNAIMAGQVANLSEQDMRDLAVYYSQQANSGGVADEADREGPAVGLGDGAASECVG